MATLSIPEAILAAVVRDVRAGYPRETCGLLIGEQADGVARVAESVQAPNLNQERPGDRYELDPRALLVADRDARQRGLEIVGVWHSHPDHPAMPSETDRAAAWEGWSYLILSVAKDGVADVRSWRLEEARFSEETITS